MLELGLFGLSDRLLKGILRVETHPEAPSPLRPPREDEKKMQTEQALQGTSTSQRELKGFRGLGFRVPNSQPLREG